jgi:hypothetical protein
VTLISAWRAKDAIVIHADSQETVGNYRVTVKKISPKQMGDFQVIVAGSGQPGALIDSFILRLESAVSKKLPSDIPQFAAVAEKELQDFYKRDVHLCPDPNKEVKFIIAAFCSTTEQYEVWETFNIALSPISYDEPTLVGWDEPLYKNTAKRLHSLGITVAQAVLAGVYLFTIAEATSNYIRSPFSIAVIRKSGIWMEEASYVQEITQRLNAYEKQINEIFLSCADTSVSMKDLQERLQSFSVIASSLHRQHIDNQIRSLTLDKISTTSDAYPKFPLGQAVIIGFSGTREIGYAQMEHDRSNEEMDEFAKKGTRHFEELGFTEYLVKRLSQNNYSLVISHRWEGIEDEDLGNKTKQEFADFLSNKELVEPMIAERIFAFLEGDDLNQTIFYARPKRSV